MPNDVPSFAMEAVNERLYRLESEVDSLKSDFMEQKVAVARITEQVSAHEKRGEERHQQILSAINDIKTDYRSVLKQQADDAKAQVQAHLEANKERSQQQTKIILAVIGLISTVAGLAWGLSPAERNHSEPEAQTEKP